jgi:hypothetical protein
MRLGKPKSDICSHSTLFNMEELAQLVEHLNVTLSNVP